MARKLSVLPPKPGKEHLLIRPKTVSEATAGMQGKEAREGFLGAGNIIRKPDFVVSESLSERERIRKRAIQKFLATVIQPNALSSKSTAEMDKRALVNKINRSTLTELERFLPEHICEMDTSGMEQMTLEEVDQEEIQNRYMAISP